MSEYLPQEIITKILLRLPIKPLLQCTCVCKSWNSLIKHTGFINTHLKTSNVNGMLLLRYCSKDPNREQYFLHVDNDTFQEYSKPDLPVKSFNKYFRIVGSCNGLVLLSDDYQYLTDINTLILWNPSLRKFITLPKSNFSKSPHYSVYGFGFDSKKSDYKVVKLVYLQRQDEGPAFPQVELYSLNSGSWKIITAAASDYVIAQTAWSQVFVNGAVHWIAFCKKGNGFRNVVLSFNMSVDIFQEIELPQELACKFPTKSLVISTVGKSISAKHYDQNGHNIWVMREYGVVESWTKQFFIDLNIVPNHRVLQVMGYRKNGEFLLEMYDSGGNTGKLASYDPKNNKNEFLGIHTDPGYSCIEFYTESLVLIDKQVNADSAKE